MSIITLLRGLVVLILCFYRKSNYYFSITTMMNYGRTLNCANNVVWHLSHLPECALNSGDIVFICIASIGHLLFFIIYLLS